MEVDEDQAEEIQIQQPNATSDALSRDSLETNGKSAWKCSSFYYILA